MKWFILLVLACCLVALCGAGHMVLTSSAFVIGERVMACGLLAALMVGAVGFMVIVWHDPF